MDFSARRLVHLTSAWARATPRPTARQFVIISLFSFPKTLKKADAPCPMQKSSAYKAVRFPGEHFIPLCVFYSIHRSGVKGKPRFPCRATAHLFFTAALFHPYEICQIAPGGLTRGRAAPYDTDIPKPVWRAHCRGTIPPAKLFSLGGPL